MNVECPQCHALHFDSEKLTKSTRAVPKFGSCCLQGQIRLPPFPPAPATLRDLLCGKSPLSKEFKTNIRQYNTAFAFTSLGVKVDEKVTRATGPYSFRIQGDLHHLSGALLPRPGKPAVFAQLYIHDPVAQLHFREQRNRNLNSVIMTELQAMLNATHPYVQLYKQAFQIMSEKPADEQQNVSIRLRAERNQDLRRYNLPTANDEVAAIIPGDGSEERSDHRDIVLRLNGGGLKRISQLHPSYASLHYVLLFPHGEDGWHTDIPAHQGATGRRRAPNVSQRCYHTYRLHSRPGVQPPLLWGVNLLQEYVVDAWASIEQNSLNWVRHHQKELRADVYSGLRDAAMGDRDDNLNLENHGSRVILPSTHIGSERHMNQLFQDSMAICRAFNKPDLFLTMTANPNWPDIQNALLQEESPDGSLTLPRNKQASYDRPDIVARVFEQTKNAVLKEVKGGLFGKVLACIHTIEFQKRGLPHMHLLIFLNPADKIHDADDIDSIVSAQLPDPITQPLLYETITTCMLHGPCGTIKPKAKCMVDKKCSKKYPKQFRENTLWNENSYPDYARPDNGRTVQKLGHVYDNRDVVPYNPYLCAK